MCLQCVGPDDCVYASNMSDCVMSDVDARVMNFYLRL